MRLPDPPVSPGEAVTVEVVGLPADQGFRLVQCVSQDGAAAPEDCDVPGGAVFTTASNGATPVEFVTQAVIDVGVRREVDCRVDPCHLSVQGGSGDVAAASDELTWTSEPVSPPPQLTLAAPPLGDTPVTARVSGTGFPPSEAVSLVQCPGSPEERRVRAGDCLYAQGSSGRSDDRGRLDMSVTIYPRFERSDDTLVDCRTRPNDCVLAWVWPEDSRGRMAMTRIDP